MGDTEAAKIPNKLSVYIKNVHGMFSSLKYSRHYTVPTFVAENRTQRNIVTQKVQVWNDVALMVNGWKHSC